MTNQVTTEYRNVPLTALEESKTNPRRVFDEAALKCQGRSKRRPLGRSKREPVGG